MNSKKSVAIVLAVISILTVIFCCPFSASAATTAFSQLSTSKYAKTYTISSTGRTIPYTSSSLSVRGSVTYGKSSSAYIDNTYDELYLFSVGYTNGKWWAYVSYPIGSKRANAYIPLSAITSNNGSHKATTSTGKFYCSTRSGNSTSSSYYVAKGDKVYLIATSGSKYQILYPISGGKYRIAWCSKTDYDKYCNAHVHSYTTGYEAAHPHRVYKICSCGYYYYTGETKKVSSCNTCYPNNSVVTKLNNLMNGSSKLTYGNSTASAKLGATYSNFQSGVFGSQCKGFATAVFYTLYGFNITGSYCSNQRYKLYNVNSKATTVFSVRRPSSAATVKSYLSNAKAGDFLQMSKTDTSGQHSVIIYSVDSNGVWVYHANWDNKNTISKNYLTWSQLYNRNSGGGMSLYRAK